MGRGRVRVRVKVGANLRVRVRLRLRVGQTVTLLYWSRAADLRVELADEHRRRLPQLVELPLRVYGERREYKALEELWELDAATDPADDVRRQENDGGSDGTTVLVPGLRDKDGEGVHEERHQHRVQ